MNWECNSGNRPKEEMMFNVFSKDPKLPIDSVVLSQNARTCIEGMENDLLGSLSCTIPQANEEVELKYRECSDGCLQVSVNIPGTLFTLSKVFGKNEWGLITQKNQH
mgnify:CR=1 FL=1